MFPWSDPAQPLRFDHFMAAALHEPDHGYYARRIRNVGPLGDFSTTASLSPSLGRAIGHWAAEALKSTGCRDLIELGPGSGELAKAVLAALPWHQRIRTRLHLVETSVPLRDIQGQRLGNRVQWHENVASALADCQGKACLFSNEFVDAFPIRRFKKDGEEWLEEFVKPDQSLWNPAPELPTSSVFARDWPNGQVVEIHADYHRWLGEMMGAWRQGRMLTIDYGHLIENLYHRQPNGSLRGYFHHQLIVGPELLKRPGHQDLTADVNFTDLIDWSAKRLKTISVLSQSEFLKRHIEPDADADQFVIHAQGAGEAFRCLDQKPIETTRGRSR